MNNLFVFLKKIASFLEFLLLEGIAIFFITYNRGYQSNRIYATLNGAVSACYKLNGAIGDYFSLKEKNAELAQENTRLIEELTALRESNLLQKEASDTLTDNEGNIYDFIAAKVVHSSTSNLQNYVIIDKGEADGVLPEMGVVSTNGVLGIVKTSSPHFATIIPLINTQGKLSSRIKKNKCLGSLTWNGQDSRYAQLQDIPRHVAIAQGDSIVTSGLSVVFPKGLFIGTIEKYDLKESDNNYQIEVKLGCEFKTLDYVKVINYRKGEELKAVQRSIDVQ